MTKPAKYLFYLSPVFLIVFVFTITYILHFFLPPVILSLPLTISYYSYIWMTIMIYNRRYGKDKPVLARGLFTWSLQGFTPWMYFFIFIYPFAAGGAMFHQNAPLLSWQWIAAGIPFSLINGPSEEIYWRLFLDRCGKDAGLDAKTRLWYSTALFAPWHFIFIVFLFPAALVPVSLAMTIITTFIAGLLWMIVFQKTGTILHNITSHAILNFLMIWPWAAASVLGMNPLQL